MTRSAVFLQQIEAFLARTGMTPTQFGKAACKDSSFVYDLRRGRKPNVDLVERVQEFMTRTLFESSDS